MGVLWTHWDAHPEVFIGLAIACIAYFIGVGPLRERYRLASQFDTRQAFLFIAGLVIILVSLVSPLHVLSDLYLFSAHMLQHVLLTLVVPPLLIMGTPGWLLRPIITHTKFLFLLLRFFTHPVSALILFNATFAIWHVPAVYNLSMTYHWVHILEHLLFMGTAILMWWPIASNVSELPRLSYPLQIVYLFILSITQIIVFAPIAFSRVELYQWYVDAADIFPISPLLDQQIGAIIMKIAGGAIFISLIIVTFFRWFGYEETS